MLRTALPLSCLLLHLGCASAPVTPETAKPPVVVPHLPAVESAPPVEASPAPPAPEVKATETHAVAERHELPTECARGDEPCTPPADFATRLCKARKLDVALALFHRDSPFTRAYVRQDMEAWYASARRSRPRQLERGEEVLVVASRVPSGRGVSISGGGSYDVLRWDGSCVSLMAGELSFRPVAPPAVATIPWRRLEQPLAAALAKDGTIALRNGRRREACKARDEHRCARAQASLSQTIAAYVRRGGTLPPPRHVP